MAEGYVYILTNEAMPGYVKIGLTLANDVSVRIRQLDTTAVPLPFECYYAARVPDCSKLERTLHFVFGEKRIRRNREFFRIEPDLAKSIIQLVEIAQVPLTDTEQSIDPAQREEINEVRIRREVRTFPGMGIPIGSILNFSKNRDVTCAVSSSRKVMFRGEEMSPSRAALIAVREMGYDWTAVSGMDYWEYKGLRLSDLPAG